MKKFFCMAIAFIGFSCSIQAQGDVPLDEEAIYNIQGQQLNKKPDRGVFIQSGRKYAGK